MNDTNGNRRDFLAQAGGLAGASWLALNAPVLMAAAESAIEQKKLSADWVNLTSSEAKTLTAVVDQIIPPDDLPGAAEIGVVYFIDNALGTFMVDSVDFLRQGISELETRAGAAFPRKDGFADLSFEEQTELLGQIDSTPFFNTLIFLTHLGMFAMPSKGGNKDKAGWDLLGFDNQHAWQPPFGYYDAQAAAGENN